jgi:transposase-like protein
VTEDFKQRLVELLRLPTVTYQAVADAIGMTPAVVRSWTFPIRRIRSSA